MRKFIAVLVALAALALPGIASAHTGSVTANCTTVTFSYNANFAHATTVTETYVVDGKSVTKTFSVPANHVATDVITFTSPNKAAFTITAGATWTDGTAAGSIPTTSFSPTGCAVVCVPTEKIVYVDRPVEKIVYVDRPVEVIKYVDRVVNHDVPGPTVEVTKEVPGPATTTYVDRPVTVTKTVVKFKTKVVYRDRWHTKIKLVEWHRNPGHHTPGVAG